MQNGYWCLVLPDAALPHMIPEDGGEGPGVDKALPEGVHGLKGAME